MNHALQCGRDFTDAKYLDNFLDDLHTRFRFTQLIHGDAKGADHLAGHWAIGRNIPVQVFEAEWEKYGNSAGPIRNKQMLDEGKPDLVVAFPGGNGTRNMIKQARNAGIHVVWIETFSDNNDPEAGTVVHGLEHYS